MKQGDYVLVDAMMMHAVGRVGCGAAVLLGPPPSPEFVVLDLCAMGQHLPQNYRRAECTPLIDDDLAAHGLCTTCRGWGLTSMYDHGTVDQVLDGQAGDVCPDCGGSGRKGITITVNREPGKVEGHIDMAPDAADGVTCELCATAYASQP